MLRLDDLLISYGDEKYAEVALCIDLLRALSFLHQTHHWQSAGPDFYSDHLLFERLYNTVNTQIDKVAEKSIGLGNSGLVHYKHSLDNMPKFLFAIDDANILSDSLSQKMVKKSLVAEKSFLAAGEKIMDILKEKGQLTRGLEQLLGTILDEHEGLVYLLKQRMG